MMNTNSEQLIAIGDKIGDLDVALTVMSYDISYVLTMLRQPLDDPSETNKEHYRHMYERYAVPLFRYEQALIEIKNKLLDFRHNVYRDLSIGKYHMFQSMNEVTLFSRIFPSRPRNMLEFLQNPHAVTKVILKPMLKVHTENDDRIDIIETSENVHECAANIMEMIHQLSGEQYV